MSRAIGLLILVAFVCVGLYLGCGPRAGVAKDAAIKKIDELLGPLNVKQKEVEMAYADLKEATAGLRDKRIESQVRVKSLKEKKAAFENDEAKLISDLGKLKQMLSDAESTGSIERNGKEISIEQLKSLADGIVKQIKLLKDQIVKNDVIAAAWAKNLEILKKNDDTSKAQLAKLENQLDQIRSKKSALDAMKEAATIAGPGASISDKFNELTADVDELLVNIDTEWAIEEAKLDERIAEVQTDNLVTLEELLDDKTDISSTMSEIDKLLGEGNKN
jgi:chromosome segregation ATPase